MKNPPDPRLRRILNPRLIAVVTLILGVILLLSALLEMYYTKKELTQALRQQALSVMALSQRGLDNAALSLTYVEDLLADNLLDNARLLERLDRQGALDNELLTEIARENDLFRVNVFDDRGRRIASNMGATERGPIQAPRMLLQSVLQDSTDELILGFRQHMFGAGERFAVAKHRSRGGAIVVNVDAEQMLAFRRAIGAGSFIKLVGQSPEVLYAVLQDSTGILLASQGVTSMSSPESDTFLSQGFAGDAPVTRFTEFDHEEVFEIIQIARLETKPAILRIGLSTAALHAAMHRGQLRVALASLLLLVLGVLSAIGSIGAQNYRLLQQTLSRVESYASGILREMNEAVVAVDREGKILLFNHMAETMFNVQAQEIIGRPCENLRPVCAWLTEALQDGQSRSDITRTIIVREKELFVQASVTVLADESGAIDTIFAMIKDLTEQQRLQEHIKRQEQISAMGHLASGVAHEIRNPLNAIGMISQRLHQEFAPKSDESEYLQLTDALYNETRRINDIVQQFLQFVRPPKIVKSVVDLEKVVSHVVGLMQGEAEKKGVKLSAECQPVPAIQADGDKLTQALLNLAQNSLAACSRDDHIEIGCRSEAGYVILEIRDSGSGIAPENLSKIFNLYFTTRKDGSGLGLSIVQQIVSQHDGHITVESKPGEGTRFDIFLPVA
ncbi:PAS domain-containing protein [candidate division KSB1 bacterium]|nr:PAS domain-containing protein [candidate division KSB1 bacterium]